jgi:hypothetical protein
MEIKYQITEYQEHVTPNLKLVIAVSKNKIQEHEQAFFAWEMDKDPWPEPIQKFYGTHLLVLASRKFKPNETLDDYMKEEGFSFIHVAGLAAGIGKAIDYCKIPDVPIASGKKEMELVTERTMLSYSPVMIYNPVEPMIEPKKGQSIEFSTDNILDW